MTLNLEILYSDDTSVVIDVSDLDSLDSATKTGVLSVMLWEPVSGKRIPIEYLDSNDNYTLYVQVRAGVVRLYGFDDNKAGWWHYGNPSSGDGYTKPVIPPQCYSVESPGERKFHFFGEQVDNSIWATTETKRLEMQRRSRDV